jgi:hypothetical protein
LNSLNHLKEKAILFRKNGMSLTDIQKRLSRNKTTIYYWIKDVEIEKNNVFLKTKRLKNKKSLIAAGRANRKKFLEKHNEYTKKADIFWKDNKDDPEFKEFIMGYICEGDKKDRHSVSICNSDNVLMKFFYKWFVKINIHNKPIQSRIQMHVDQKEEELKKYWNNQLGLDLSIKCMRKSNTGKLYRRSWASKYGVLTIRFFDSYAKTMLNYYIEEYKKTL